MKPTGKDTHKMNTVPTVIVALLVMTLAYSHTASASIIININSELNTIADPIVVNLEAGDYRVLPIGVTDGGLYNALNPWGDEPNGWFHVYSISSASIDANQFPGTFWENNRGVFQNYRTDLIALANAPIEHFTLLSNEDVSFYIADGTYSDNAGGISIDVTVVPVPSSVVLLLSGMGLLLRQKFFSDKGITG